MLFVGDFLQLAVQLFPTDTYLSAAEGVMLHQLILHGFLPGPHCLARIFNDNILLTNEHLTCKFLQKRSREGISLDTRVLLHSLLCCFQEEFLMQNPLMHCCEKRKNNIDKHYKPESTFSKCTFNLINNLHWDVYSNLSTMSVDII